MAVAVSKPEHSSVLYITYDGLLDPLGGSQILPYVRGIASHVSSIHVLSFEKPFRYSAEAGALRLDLQHLNIGWSPLSFTAGLGKLGKVWDLLRMYGMAIGLQLRHRFDVVHCRSYQAMQVGCLLKRLFAVKVIFDMRGLWVDERVDGGLWPQSRLINRLAYHAYKRIERGLLRCASHIIALTKAVVPELRRLSPEMFAPVTVIPCCADFAHFTPPTVAERLAVRREMGIPADALLIAYLGSLGTWYLLDEMLAFFAMAAERHADVHFLFITRDWGEVPEALLVDMGLQSLRARIHVRPADRNDVPKLLGSADIMLSFIKPAYSKMASSPTKLAEAFALGIPVISNSGVGDVEQITRNLDAGAIVDLAAADALPRLVDDLYSIRAKGGIALRDQALGWFDLSVAAGAYRRVYESLSVTPR